MRFSQTLGPGYPLIRLSPVFSGDSGRSKLTGFLSLQNMDSHRMVPAGVGPAAHPRALPLGRTKKGMRGAHSFPSDQAYSIETNIPPAALSASGQVEAGLPLSVTLPYLSYLIISVEFNLSSGSFGRESERRPKGGFDE